MCGNVVFKVLLIIVWLFLALLFVKNVVFSPMLPYKCGVRNFFNLSQLGFFKRQIRKILTFSMFCLNCGNKNLGIGAFRLMTLPFYCLAFFTTLSDFI